MWKILQLSFIDQSNHVCNNTYRLCIVECKVVSNMYVRWCVYAYLVVCVDYHTQVRSCTD